MSERSTKQRSFYDPEVIVPGCLKEGSLQWVLARLGKTLFPEWLFAGWRSESKVGRPPWPALVLIKLMVLRWSQEGMSRLSSTKEANENIVWRAALCLPLGDQGPKEKTMREFEQFMRSRHLGSGVPRYLLLHEHIVRLCLEAGVVGREQEHIWAMDGTPMWCYGAVEDTINLLGNGTQKLLRRWCRFQKRSFEHTAKKWGLNHLLGKSIKGSFKADKLRNPEKRSEVLETLVDGALLVIKEVRRNLDSLSATRRHDLLKKCRNLAKVIDDNIETNKQGKLVIAKRVENRTISLTDPEARHSRKSKSQKFNGFKIHLLGDVLSGLIASLTVTSAGVYEDKVAHRLIIRAKNVYEEIDSVLGDAAYGGAKLRHDAKTASGVEILAPPKATKKSKTGLSRDMFQVDFETGTVTCPNGVATNDLYYRYSAKQKDIAPVYRWSEIDCQSCEKHDRCCPKTKRHIREFHPYEAELRQSREDWKNEDKRESYRKRSLCERLINRVVQHGGRKARSQGLAAANLQAHTIVLVTNLLLLAEYLQVTAL